MHVHIFHAFHSHILLECVFFSRCSKGGQLTTTTDVENFPGFPDGILGYDLIMDMKKQTERFGTKFLQEHVESVDFSSRPYKLSTYKNTYYADTVIIASGLLPVFILHFMFLSP